MNIQVEIKCVYGNETIYPVCAQAKKLAELIRQKTFTHQDIQKIKALGFTVEVVQAKKVL